MMAIINSTELNETNIGLVYCYSIDSDKAIITHDGVTDSLELLEYNKLSDLLLTEEWKQPEGEIQ